MAQARSLAGFGYLVLALNCLAQEQDIALHGYAATSLRIEESTQSGSKILGAELRENLFATWGVLRIELNESHSRTGWIADYLDSEGRICLSLAFGPPQGS